LKSGSVQGRPGLLIAGRQGRKAPRETVATRAGLAERTGKRSSKICRLFS
jgi:hypothetical protein